MKRKVVIKLAALNEQKSRSKAIKIVSCIQGVESVALHGKEGRMEVTGDGLDTVLLTTRLREKLGAAELVSVICVDDQKKAKKEGGGGDDLKNLVHGVAQMEKQKSKEMKKKAEELVQEAHVLKRRIDILHLIFSFPVETQADQKMEFDSLCHKFSRINQLVRQLQDSHDYEKIQDLLLEVCEQLDKYKSSALIPDPPEFRYNLAIDSAVQQILQYLKHRSFGKIKICGNDADKVAEALKDLPEIKLIFDAVHSIFVSDPSIVELKQKIAEHTSKGGHTTKTLILVNCTGQLTDLHELDLDMPIVLMLILPSREVNQMWPVDLEIRMEDHLVPWKLFCHNVGKAVQSSSLQRKAARLIEECHGHLLAIVLLARALKDVTDVNYWELALRELLWLPSPEVNRMSVPLVNVLRFIWERMDDKTKNCIKYYAAHIRKGKLSSTVLICGWISCGAIATEEEGESILAELTDSFVLESVGEGLVCMAEEVRLVLQNIFVPENDPAYLMQGDLGLARTPKTKEWNVKEIHLMNNQLSMLPSSPNCPVLVKLFLQGNLDLMAIPSDFFEHMPMLQVLDLSYTSIKILPYSISKLNALQKFFLRGCELLVRLPHGIGKLTSLEVFDLEGTELMYLPREIGELVNLTCLKVCFYGDANLDKQEEVDRVIPKGTLSYLPQLNELSIDILPEGDWWNVEVRDIVAELSCLKGLRQLKLYLPAVELLNDLNMSQIYSDLTHFRFTVGHHRQRFISRVPQKVDEEFNNLEKGLKYINGRSISSEISEVLKHANAFFLERHWTLKSLSKFGIPNLDKLKFCVVVECRELRTIIDAKQFCQKGYGKGDGGESVVHVSEFGVQNVLPSLQYLSIHYMKTMESICIGTIGKGCLSNLKYLALRTCPNLTILFTLSVLGNLVKLEELIIQDCPKINNLVSLKSSDSTSSHFLPSLKKMSLLQLPELVSISNGLCVAPKLERLVIFYCPKLKLLSKMDLLSKDLKVIKGEQEWWDTLMWYESDMSRADQDFLTQKFIPLERNGHLMAQLTKD